MNWHYALGGQQQGPVDDAQLDALIAAGTINPETLVWREGLPNWQPLRQARPGVMPAPAAAPPPAAPAPAGAGDVTCGECGKPFTRDNVIQYGNAFVCAACKPVFLQRLREGAAPAAASGGYVTEEQLLAREYRIDIGECLSRAWRTFADNAGIILGVSLLMFVLYAAIGVPAFLIGMFIPLFMNVVLAVVNGPIFGGYLWFQLRLARGEPAGVGDAFGGFTQRFVPLMLSSLIQELLNLVCMAPIFIVAIIAGVSGAFNRGQSSEMAVGLLVMIILAVLVSIAAVAYVATLWTHSFLLVADKGYKFWPAMQLSRKLVQKRWWMTFLFHIVGGIIAGAGILACGVGMIVTSILYMLMRVWLYDDNFRDLEPQASAR